MAVTINSGLVDDADILSNERVIDMSDIIDTLESDFTQFSSALMKVRSKPANSSKVEWLEAQVCAGSVRDLGHRLDRRHGERGRLLQRRRSRPQHPDG